MWDRWVQILMSQCDLPALQQLIPIFDGLLHLSANDQNIIISSASSLLGQEVQEFIGSLLALHNRHSQIWERLNRAASEEHRSEALSLVAQAAGNSSLETIGHVTHQPAHPVIITSDMEICQRRTNLPETHRDAERSSPVQRSPAPSLNWRPVVVFE